MKLNWQDFSDINEVVFQYGSIERHLFNKPFAQAIINLFREEGVALRVGGDAYQIITALGTYYIPVSLVSLGGDDGRV